ncbi:helix-turn-helix transcriptional regulator [Thermobifida halotolerans]|uniref:Helix-turn-helix transcriptional regulator n=1 Tax=Thermobifida halotolerans TaxID=483545 RepID=A0A399G6F8_9ACTN|nr:helix-turn-helix transcriptional regulator [Thermobifida halotolerans]UOE17774.1 helix-turn-helix transcriptional regulator [Thermobifida halotolerans]
MSESPRQHAARAELARLLRSLRLDSGRSGEQLAAALGWSQSKISKIERGRTRPSRGDAESWARTCGADTAALSRVAELAEAALVEARHWRASHRGGLARRQREVAAIEERATLLRSFQPTLVPGLLQTAAYARQVLTLADVSGRGDVAAAVAERLRRQEALYRERTDFAFTLTEAALWWHAEDRSVLLPQIDRLLSVATLPNVTVRVLPLTTPSGAVPSHGFLLYEEDEEPRVIVETHTRELVLTDPDEVAAYRTLHGRFTERALPVEDTRDFLLALRQRIGGGD